MTVGNDDDIDEMAKRIQAAIQEEERRTFSEKVLEEYNNPKNMGRMTDPDGSGIIRGPCGDTMEIYLRVADGRITDAAFMTDGCGPTIACGSMLTGMVKGMTADDVGKVTDKTLIDALDGLPEENLHCAKLAVDTLHKALEASGTKRDRHVFNTSLVWAGEKTGRFTREDRPALEGATPPEFGGQAGMWNPEELFVGSYELCLMTTFLVIAEKFRLTVSGYESRAEGVIEKGEKYFRFTRVSVNATIRVAPETDVKKVEKAVEVTKKACFVSNSLSCDADYTVAVVVEGA
jgi:nitrogen fixation NifU-like protein